MWCFSKWLILTVHYVYRLIVQVSWKEILKQNSILDFYIKTMVIHHVIDEMQVFCPSLPSSSCKQLFICVTSTMNMNKTQVDHQTNICNELITWVIIHVHIPSLKIIALLFPAIIWKVDSVCWEKKCGKKTLLNIDTRTTF